MSRQIYFYNLLSTNSSICGISSVLRRFFVLETVVDALRRNRSAGWTFKAFAIFTIRSNEGFVVPASICPIRPFVQSAPIAS